MNHTNQTKFTNYIWSVSSFANLNQCQKQELNHNKTSNDNKVLMIDVL